jgi:hypothetical protein
VGTATTDALKSSSRGTPELVPAPTPKAPLPSVVAPQAGAGRSASVQPPTNGRQITQSAALDLGAPADRVDDVAQQVFNVVGRVGGIVDRSSVTATGGPDGNAQFQLRVPSSQLAQTMTALSKLKYGHVLSRTDNSQDINSSFVSANRRLADATAVRTALLKKLAVATSQQEIASLKAQIHDAEATIARAQSDLRSLSRLVNFSQISVTIQASSTGTTGGGGFSLHTAAHDALKVLTVAAGVALIALAALVPLGLLGALGWWIATTVQRRRREQALDLA